MISVCRCMITCITPCGALHAGKQDTQHVLTLCNVLLSPPYRIGQAIIFSSCGFFFFFLLLFFLAYFQPSHIGCPPYFHTCCGLSAKFANLEYRSEMCCTRLAEMQDAKNRQSFAICALPHNFLGLLSSQLRHVSTIGKKGFRVFASLLYRRRSTDVNQTLHDVWPSLVLVHYIYIFGGSCHLAEFCNKQNSFCVQVLRSPILAALLHAL